MTVRDQLAAKALSISAGQSSASLSVSFSAERLAARSARLRPSWSSQQRFTPPPLAGQRSDREPSATGPRLAVAIGLAVTVRRLDHRSARAVTAAGWAAHPLFDLTHATHGSRLPHWYADICAGYDLALAATLIRRPAAPRGIRGWTVL